jgi:proteic killer suppression protein
MIKSFGDKATSDLFHGNSSRKVRKLPTQILNLAIYKLDILNAATFWMIYVHLQVTD